MSGHDPELAKKVTNDPSWRRLYAEHTKAALALRSAQIEHENRPPEKLTVQVNLAHLEDITRLAQRLAQVARAQSACLQEIVSEHEG